MRDPAIAEEDPRAPDVLALLEESLAFHRAQAPPEDVHALDADGLADPTMTLFSLRDGGVLQAIGALKQLDGSHVELKAMHTAPAARGRGVGRTLLGHLLAEAAARGARRVSLETGSMVAYAPARALYAQAGFEECEPFGDYRPSANSTFMTLHLDRVTLAWDGKSLD